MPHQNGASSAIVIHIPVFTPNIANTSNRHDVLARPVDVETPLIMSITPETMTTK
jgi:hypothetical protein